MSDLWVGAVAIVVGALLCFRGRLAVRAIMALWGGLVGFGLGASLAAAFTREGFLGGPIGWIVAILAALLCARLAYSVYVLGVVIVVGSIGFGLGAAAGRALGLASGGAPWAGVAGAVLLVAVALAANVPGLLLTVLSAVAGAAALVGGLMVLTGAAPARALPTLALPAAIGTEWGWSLLFLLTALAGIVVQSRLRPWRSGRDAWPAGRHGSPAMVPARAGR